jgi:lambda family phage minor tail protein L
MPIRADVQQLTPQSLVEMYVWDDTVIGGTNVIRWHPGTTVAGQPITWQGQIYTPFPIEATGFEITGTGDLPRPRLRASNIGGTLGAYLRQMSGALGAKLTRKRTFAKYLDAVNFPDGNPYANSMSALPDDVFYMARKVSENAIMIEIELATRFDVMGIQLPRRQVLAQICPWTYRSVECT